MVAVMNIRSNNIFADGAAYVNGDYMPVGEASIPLTDLGFIRSDATYDVVHVWNGKFFRLEDHVNRFLGSCERLRFSLPLTRDKLIYMLHAMVARTGFDKAYVNFTATRGRLAKGSRNPLDCENQIYGFTIPFSWITPLEEQEAGIAMIVAQPERTAPEAMDPTIKNFQWGDLTRGMIEASDSGAKVAVHLNREGNLTEGAGFNAFVFKDGTLWTPDTGVLMGITRRTVLEIAERLGLNIRIAAVSGKLVRDADEIFISSTAGGVIPVRTLDGVPVGGSANSRIALEIREAYWKLHDDPAYATPVRYDLVDA